MAINRSTQQRQNYGLGSFVKKAVNKVTRPFTKVAQKLMPKELAGIARIAAPFVGGPMGTALYAAGTAKQKGRISPLDLAFMAAPYARFSRAPTQGGGIFGTNTNFRFGQGTTQDYGLRDLITGGERGGYFEGIGGEGLLGKIPGATDYGLKADEFLFGSPAIEDSYGIGTSGTEAGEVTFPITGRGDTPGIIGKGGEMSTFFGVGDSPKILESKLGQLAFGDAKKPGEFSKLKLGSWGAGIVTKIQQDKILSELEAEEAAEAALLAENAAADQETIEAAREWASRVFGRLSPADVGLAKGGRIGYADAGPVLPPDPTQPVNPFGPRPPADAPVLPNKEMAETNSMKLLEDMAMQLFGKPLDQLDDRQREMIMSFMKPQAANGGLMRTNYALGTKPEPKESGLGGLPIEADMRYTGGFMPYGKKEKADDVPARLSKNEFVFTADAVKAAGGGSMNEGARKMYQTMKMLEQQNRMMS